MLLEEGAAAQIGLAKMSSNCMVSASIGCLFCCQGCNAKKLINAVTFLPPQASYTIEYQEKSDCQDTICATGGKVVYLHEGLRSHSFYLAATDRAEATLIKTSRGERIPVVWVRRSRDPPELSEAAKSDKQPLVLLHCHGNAADVGIMMGPYFELAGKLGVEVVGVEYSGYGVSTGSPSSANTIADVEAAYHHLISRGVPAERIVAYGQSVGSGPVVALASKYKLGGVILHSPMLSGIKVIDPQPERCCRPSCVFCCFDFFPNGKLIRSASCPAFVMHGQCDDVIPFYHGSKLSDNTPKDNRWPPYFPRAGHNDIVEKNTAAYYQQVGQFLRSVAQKAGAPCRPEAYPPLQVEMQEPRRGADVVPAERLYAEPACGPENGLYHQMRRGQEGTAREVRMAPGRPEEQ